MRRARPFIKKREGIAMTRLTTSTQSAGRFSNSSGLEGGDIAVGENQLCSGGGELGRQAAPIETGAAGEHDHFFGSEKAA